MGFATHWQEDENKNEESAKIHTPKMLQSASRMTRIIFGSLALSSEHSGVRQFCSRQ